MTKEAHRLPRPTSAAAAVLLCAVCVFLLSTGCTTTETGTEGQRLSSDLSAEDVRVEKRIEAPEKSNSELFVLSSRWLGDRLMEDERLIEFVGKKRGVLIGELVYPDLNQGQYKFIIRFHLRIGVEDQSARIVLSDPMYRSVGVDGGSFDDRSYRPLRSKKWFERYCLPKYRELTESYRQMLYASP